MDDMNFILQTAGTYDEVYIHCPVCGSKQVLVNLDKYGNRANSLVFNNKVMVC
jgi:hypothetical protein